MNIGGYDKYAFYERLGVNYLEGELLRTFRIISYFNVNDKTPNLDGWFDLCDQSAKKCHKVVPRHRFSVQIKTLNHDYRNTNKRKNQKQQYKYQCDTKVISTVLTNITFDPVLLFLVDADNEQVFYKYLSMEFCFSTLSPSKKRSFTLYFSDRDKVDFSSDIWIAKLIEIRNKHKTELSYGRETLFMASDGDPKVMQQIYKASNKINYLMEGCFSFLRHGLFPDTWKFGVAYLKRESGMISAGIYRIVKGTNGECFKIFDQDDDQMILSYNGKDIDIITVIKDYLNRCIEYFFSNDGFAAQLTYLPDVVLNEIIFEELDHQFLYLQSCGSSRKLKKGDKVHLGLQANELSIEEYNKLKEQRCTTVRADVCVQELLQRDQRKFTRSWRKSLTGMLGEKQVWKVSKEIFLNAEQLDLPDEVKGFNYYTSNEEEIKSENIQILIKNIQDFYNESCRKLGNDFCQKIGNHQIYVFDLVGEVKITGCPNFIFHTEKAECQTIMTGIETFNHYHHLALDYIDFSWYKMWRILFRHMILEYLMETNKPILMEFLASR